MVWIYLFKNTAVMYFFCILFALVGSGHFIRLYGQICGMNFFDPRSWVTSSFLIGSPICKTLNQICYISSSIVENSWFYMGTSGISMITAFFSNWMFSKKEKEEIKCEEKRYTRRNYAQMH